MSTYCVLLVLQVRVRRVGLLTAVKDFPSGEECPILVTMLMLFRCRMVRVLTGLGMDLIWCPRLLSGIRVRWAVRLLWILLTTLLSMSISSRAVVCLMPVLIFLRGCV